VHDFRPALAALAFAALIGHAALAQASYRSTQHAPGSTLDLPGFSADLDRVIAVMRSTEAAELPAVRDSIPLVWTVRTPGGQVQVPGEWIRRELEEARRDPKTWPSRRARLTTHLSWMRGEATALQTRVTRPDSRAARVTLSAVLAEKEFRGIANASAMSRLRTAISDWLVRLWRRVGGERLGGSLTAVVFAWAAGLLALAVLGWWIARTLLENRDHGRLALSVPPPARQSARAWALAAAAASDPREAARFAYRATVRRLEEEGAWKPDDARTPREHMKLLANGHNRRPLFADVAGRFEEIWFGGRKPSGEDVREMLVRLKELGCLPAD